MAKTQEEKVEEAQALVEQDAKEKAEASAKAAKKAKADAEAAVRAALTPEQRLGRDWPKKHTEIAPYVTEIGKIRGGLNVPGTEKAKKILKDYGFDLRKV